MRNALNEGTPSRDKSDADDAIAIAAKKVAEETKGKSPCYQYEQYGGIRY